MKKTPIMYKMIFAVLFLGTLVSCQDFLEENPKGNLASDNFWISDANAIGAIKSIYTKPVEAGARATTWPFWFETAGQDYRNNSDANYMVAGTWNSSNFQFSDLWNTAYESIGRANWALDNLPGAQVNDGLKKKLEGEARFLRAMHYFNLVRAFGKVPLIMHSVGFGLILFPSRSPVDSVYSAIIEDLTFAENNLPLKSTYGNADKGRASKGAAQSLLSKVYLTLGDWDKAKAAAQSVIESGEFGLFQDYRDIWKAENDLGKEWVFSYLLVAGTNSSRQNVAVFGFPPKLRGVDGYGNGFGNNILDSTLVALFDKQKDTRFKELTWNHYVTSTGEYILFRNDSAYFSRKYDDVDWNTNYQFTRINYPLMRYAEVLLIYAEAENEINPMSADAFEKLNEVRTRAGLDPLGPADIGTKDEFLQAVMTERRREFFDENKRTWDLRRRGIFLQTMHGFYPRFVGGDNTVLFPLPQSEVDANPNLVQNDGY